MSQEDADKNVKETPKNRTWLSVFCLFICILCLITTILLKVVPTPWKDMFIEGTATVFNENGESITSLPIQLKFFSHYAPGPFRSYERREGKLHVDISGQVYGKPGKFYAEVPKYAATLFFYTDDGEYATIVDISPEKPTGLVVKLRPRYTVTGRLVDDKGTPLANQKIQLSCSRDSDFGRDGASNFHEFALSETFHFEKATTDEEGIFTINNVIPGIDYDLSVSYQQPSQFASYRAATLDMPLLSPEQYQQPFDLGDISVSPASR